MIMKRNDVLSCLVISSVLVYHVIAENVPLNDTDTDTKDIEVMVATAEEMAEEVTVTEAQLPPITPSIKRKSWKTKWISELFSQTRDSFNVASNVSSSCRNDFNLLQMFASNQTVWAIRMLESSEWPLVGLFSGKLFHTGDYDECLKASGTNFKGQYCLIRAFINISSTTKPNQTNLEDHDTDWPDEEASAYDVLSAFDKNPKRKSRNEFTWALCLPSSCSVADVRRSVDETLQSVFGEYGFRVVVHVNPHLCTTEESVNYPFGYYVAWVIFVLIIALVISSTVYDLRDSIAGENDWWLAIKLFKCFSIRHSYINLTHYSSPASTNPGIYLLKLIYFVFIVIGHRIFMNALAFTTGQSEVLEMSSTSDFISLLNMDVIDVFFMLTGFLTFHLGYFPMRKCGVSYIFMSVGIRWIKLMPVYSLLLLFITQIFPYIGEGPWWKYRVLAEVQNCRATWWTQLLAISNIVYSKQQCLLASWYLSVDIQLAILGGIILFAVTKNKKIGLVAIILSFCIFTELVGIMAYKKKYHGTLIIFTKMLEHLKENEQFYKYYIIGPIRVGPYLIGFGSAFLTKILQDKGYKFSNKLKILLIVGTFLLGRIVLYYCFVFHSHTRRYIPMENAVYAAIHRPMYVLPVATILCVYFTSGLGVFNHIFEMRIFIPFGRLVYSAFLVHSVIQLYHVSSQRGLQLIPKTLNLSYMVTADIVYSFVFGLFLFIIAEGPFHSISQLLHPHWLEERMRKVERPLEVSVAKNGVHNQAFADEDDDDEEATDAC